MYILLVEDDAVVGDGVMHGLTALQFQVDWLRCCADARQAIEQVNFDAMVLDLGLPDGDGLQLLKQLRAAGNTLPVLILTARDAVPDRIRGLHQGADDYLPKPFDLNELAARLQALQRRANGLLQEVIQYGKLTFNPVSQEVFLDKHRLMLSRSEIIVLSSLLNPPGRIMNNGQLQDRLYGWSEGVESNAVAVHIHNLRRKLGDGSIETVRGQGYRLCAIK